MSKIIKKLRVFSLSQGFANKFMNMNKTTLMRHAFQPYERYVTFSLDIFLIILVQIMRNNYLVSFYGGNVFISLFGIVFIDSFSAHIEVFVKVDFSVCVVMRFFLPVMEIGPVSPKENWRDIIFSRP